MSVFLRDGDKVFHTYSTYARGTEPIGGAYHYLDLTALGRQEDWEEPRGRSTGAPRAGEAGRGRDVAGPASRLGAAGELPHRREGCRGARDGSLGRGVPA